MEKLRRLRYLARYHHRRRHLNRLPYLHDKRQRWVDSRRLYHHRLM
jgi:hypothetical protein